MALVGVLVFGLGGCSLFSKFRGQSTEQATEQLRSVEGLEGKTEASPSMSGFTSWVDAHVTVQIKSGYEISDPKAFTTWLVSLAWSMNERKIDSSIAISVRYEEEPVVRDWGGTAALQSEGFTSAEGEPDEILFRVRVDADDVEKNLGTWPGKVPEIPEGMLARVSE